MSGWRRRNTITHAATAMNAVNVPALAGSAISSRRKKPATSLFSRRVHCGEVNYVEDDISKVADDLGPFRSVLLLRTKLPRLDRSSGGGSGSKKCRDVAQDQSYPRETPKRPISDPFRRLQSSAIISGGGRFSPYPELHRCQPLACYLGRSSSSSTESRGVWGGRNIAPRHSGIRT